MKKIFGFKFISLEKPSNNFNKTHSLESRQRNSFLTGFIFFFLTQFFGILVGQNIFLKFPKEIIKISSEKFSYLNFFLGFSILVFLFLFILRFKKVKNIFSRIIFYFSYFFRDRNIFRNLVTWFYFFAHCSFFAVFLAYAVSREERRRFSHLVS